MRESIKKQIGRELIKLRIDNDINIEQLSTETKLNKNTISDYENGKKKLSFDVLAVLLDFFGITFDIFFAKVYSNMQNNETKKET